MATTTTPRKAAAAKAPAKSTNVAKKRVPVIGTSGPKTVTRSKAATFTRTNEAEARKRLAALIPPMEKAPAENGGEYFSRDLWGVKDMIVFQKSHNLQKNLMMFGDTGAGKSMSVEAYCALNQIPLVVVNCHGGIDPNTFWGMLEQDPVTKVIRWVDSDITIAMEWGPAVIFFDEVNFTPPRTFSVFHSALRQRFFTILERNNERREVHDGTWFVAAYNPDDRYEGTRPLNKAFKNRFPVKIEWEYDPDIEAQLSSLPVLQDIAKNLRDRAKESNGGDFETPVATNMLVEFEDIALDYQEDFGTKVAIDFAIGNFVAAFNSDEKDAVRTILNNERSVIDRQFSDFLKSLD